MGKIALYDLDRTITKRPTYTGFLLHAAWRHEKWRLPAIFVWGAISAGYLVGLIDRARLKEIGQEMLLGPALPAAKAAAIAESYAARVVAQNVHVQALGRIAADHEAGRRLVIASASFAFYVVAIARQLGFDDVIATASQTDEDGAILPRIGGENCYAEAKRRMVETWMAQEGIDPDQADIRFYSDSESDLPTFELAATPIAVNPTRKLRQLAEKRGWRIVSWG